MRRVRAAVFWTVLLLAGFRLAGLAERIEPVEGRSGMVVAGHPEAAEIGLEILKAGGNAMDATVAVSLALGVAEPYGSGLGGKAVILYHEASSGRVWYVDGMDAAGSRLDAAALAVLDRAARAQGGHAVAVPGLAAALAEAHARWGRLPWRETVLPAADLAGRGFLVVPGMRVFFESRLERIRATAEASRLYLPGGEPPAGGSRMANPDLERTLRILAEQGAAGFYDGVIAARLADGVAELGGSFTREDLRGYRARIGEAPSIEWEDLRIYSSAAPTTGGATVLLALEILEGHPWDKSAGLQSAVGLDAWARALGQAFPAVLGRIGDVEQADASWRELFETEFVGKLRRAGGLGGAGEAITEESTTHFVIADAEGNWASVTQSLSHHFGSGVVVPGTGVILNNSVNNFIFDSPGNVNAPAPGKRPPSTIAPVIVTREGRPVLALGVPGGARIPTATLTVLIDHLAFGRTLGEAIAAPRVHLLRRFSGEPTRVIQFEEAPPGGLFEELSRLGWEPAVVEDAEFFGGMNAVELSAAGVLTGWADYRRTNAAAGF